MVKPPTFMPRAKPRPAAKRLVAAGHDVSSCLVNAAALQDHLVRSLNIAMPPRVKLGKPKAPPHQATPILSATKASPLPQHMPLPAAGTGYRNVWVCESCTFENSEEMDARCSACGSFKPNNRRHKLTLAQKKGLVQAPPPKLSQNQWEDCEAKAEERGDTVHPCSICREPFGLAPKVILSCTHMFHQNCLASFERFLRTNQRVCPLCRKQNYQKRHTKQGEQSFRIQCTIKIQSFVRGFIARRRFPSLLRQYFKAGLGSPTRRQAFYASKISNLSDRIVCAIEAREDSIDALLASFDKSLTLSRHVFRPDQGNGAAAGNLMTQDKWNDTLRKALVRDEKECPICYNSIDCFTTKPIALLSCSHVLHADCLHAFETFNIYEVHLCPVCRAKYESRPVHPDMTFAA
ncbi:hypothetical protein H310_07251 [Aphanomyces invadans]|uniref:RING-type domain-containing protein n=1 Tax=Aphanomyces invadans TaxID=157072 RepID=A0A024U460_9STRA|nr:hypothetical protein H310_07251 [Aphanomyces invadans]ETW00692.1 hypothetical protein H310_07251 [Aphanomyces invadans]|eukprot:XP_008870827.1 hypothetical protein H310_07251 [Aphanomyces invadans]